MILGSLGSLRLPSRTELYTNIRDTTRPSGRPAELRHAEIDFPDALVEPSRVLAAAVDLPARRPLVALGPDEPGRLLVKQRVGRLLDGLPHQILYVFAQRLLVGWHDVCRCGPCPLRR